MPAARIARAVAIGAICDAIGAIYDAIGAICDAIGAICDAIGAICDAIGARHSMSATDGVPSAPSQSAALYRCS
eukprot:1366005-Rhodomonas_salina.10